MLNPEQRVRRLRVSRYAETWESAPDLICPHCRALFSSPLYSRSMCGCRCSCELRPLTDAEREAWTWEPPPRYSFRWRVILVWLAALILFVVAGLLWMASGSFVRVHCC